MHLNDENKIAHEYEYCKHYRYRLVLLTSVRKVATPLRELTCHMGSHSVTCHPAEVTFPPLPQPKLVLA